MTTKKWDVVICGAGMAGITAAYHLTVRQGIKNVLLIDERTPLTLTSNKGTQAYRNWWPGPDDTMVRFINRSIDLLEELAQQNDNFFQLNRRGYLFLTSNPAQIASWERTASEISALGAGPLRRHPGAIAYQPSPTDGFENIPNGADLLLDQAQLKQLFPFVTEKVIAGLHIRRAGWFDTNRLGHWLLEQAQAQGAEIWQDRIERVQLINNRVDTIHLGSGTKLPVGAFVIAAGPYLKPVGALLGLDIPVFNELHGKIAFKDHLGITPANVPLMIWDDPVTLSWTEAERARLAASAQTRWLLEEFPAGVHFRPRGTTGDLTLLIIWTYQTKIQELVWPPKFDPYYAEILLRGLAGMIPNLSAYFGQGEQAYVDGGYYCKTRENRPLIGPLPVAGAFVIGALSGFGIMAAQAAGELLAAHITGNQLPDYASAFSLARYQDPAYQSLLERLDQSSGQL
ncbi:MAG: FAD-dependent oxidoreductase [Acidobacteriota bacterium]